MSVVDDARDVLCPCAVCGDPVYDRPHQDRTARTCGPGCARKLAVQEHPEINAVAARESMIESGSDGPRGPQSGES